MLSRRLQRAFMFTMLTVACITGEQVSTYSILLLGSFRSTLLNERCT